ncbi:MAG: CNNM domain-containing protein [Candidatus Omnitrophota bacterium]|nr:DUF21 domain-containing protein [Candidatus Omnitrophota bacterium]
MNSFISWFVVSIFLVIFAAISFFFSASETAIIGLSKIRLRHMVAKGIKRSRRIQNIVSNLDDFIVALLVGNNFVNIAISAIITGVFVRLVGYNWGVIISTLVTTFLVLIFCEITPKMLAIKHTERVALLVSPFMDTFTKLFRPLVHVFIRISKVLVKLFGIKTTIKRSPLITEEELRMMIELGKEEGFLNEEEGRMLQNIFKFGDIKVADVMIPKEKIIAINVNARPEELLDIFVEQGHARLPVFSGSIDKILGIVYAHDLLYILRDRGLFVLQDILHNAYFASADMAVNELLRKFQQDKMQIAVVVDKNNRTLGLVTLEDLIEEIVGEIEETGHRHIANKH